MNEPVFSAVSPVAPTSAANPTTTSNAFERLGTAIAHARDALLARQRPDGHWVFEFEADATIPAEYVLLTHYLGEPDTPARLELERKIATYLRRQQLPEGGWPLFLHGAFDASASVKAYFALKMIGDAPDAPHMQRARQAILAHGGAAASNVFTRILLALFGVIDWRAVPVMPVEIMLLPRWFPFHLSKISYWARTVIVPLLVVQARGGRARNPRGVGIEELFVRPAAATRLAPRAPHQHTGWFVFFRGVDAVLRATQRWFPARSRAHAIEQARVFVDTRLNGEDGLGAIFPAMANAVMMYDVLGIPATDARRAIARKALDKLLEIKTDEAYCQPCLSPVWDTALAAHALLETGDPLSLGAARRGLDWLLPLQILEQIGDWSVRRPQVRPGGWAFQYANPHYPDVDDTAVVVAAMDRIARLDTPRDGRYDAAIARAREWVIGMQSSDGGWGAFEPENTHEYLNNIPFSDHGAMLDPPTADVSARCLSMLAQCAMSDARTGEDAGIGAATGVSAADTASPRPALAGITPAQGDAAARRALHYLLAAQERNGSWFGRWGSNYIYGTWSALCALNAAGLGAAATPVARAADWLCTIQNDDGGWGEDCSSYRLDYDGHRTAPSQPSQTAWALLALMASGRVEHAAVRRGVEWLLEHQGADGFWLEGRHNAPGFPRVFYLLYHGYAKFFPLWALARYRNLLQGTEQRVRFGL
ncbi:MAG: squalene--hopene cyclase [Janthinobacterium lividum]